MRPFADSSSRVRLPQHFCPSQRATDTRHGFIASGMTTVHVKFPSEATHATVTVPTPATPAGVCAAVLAVTNVGTEAASVEEDVVMPLHSQGGGQNTLQGE